MALLQIIAGSCGAFLVVPLCGALTIWLTFTLGRRLFERRPSALWGAALVAASPVFLYQLMNAMSDVPVTAAWTLVLVLVPDGRWPAASPTERRPDPAEPGAGVGPSGPGGRHQPGIGVAFCCRPRAGAGRRAAGELLMYGSPLTSGYGELGHYYAWEYALANLRRYPVWIVDTQTPLVLLALCLFVAPAWLPTPPVPRLRLLFGGFIGIVLLYRTCSTRRLTRGGSCDSCCRSGPRSWCRSGGGAGRVRAAMDRAVVVGCQRGPSWRLSAGAVCGWPASAAPSIWGGAIGGPWTSRDSWRSTRSPMRSFSRGSIADRSGTMPAV